MKQFSTLILRLSLAVGLLLSFSVPVYGAENGGAVQTNGVIEFYDDTEPSTSEPTPSSEPEPSTSEEPKPSEEPTPSSSSEPIVTKPQGKYPSTGELVKTSLTVSGVALVVLALLFFLWKRKKDKEESHS